ncbi:hypothetical protein QAD02_003604 [Eretmocerus hayati]|uniref:Uncharacterized protein n=1 Tax=Eretmocerus hayati TaxID=131215 RepID=A0ACC2NS29_9HYME|nr:hypothetical protein QAD02_003604 [Eretmocerus hayati]
MQSIPIAPGIGHAFKASRSNAIPPSPSHEGMFDWKEHNKVLELQPSGFARDDIEHDWLLYKDMLWIKLFIEHLSQASNGEDSPQGSDQTGPTFKKKKPSTSLKNESEVLGNL